MAHSQHWLRHLIEDASSKAIVVVDFGTDATCVAYKWIDGSSHTYIIDEQLDTSLLVATGFPSSTSFGQNARRQYIHYHLRSRCVRRQDAQSAHNHAKPMNHKIELLFLGYCRQTEQEMNYLIPESIQCIIHQYTPKYPTGAHLANIWTPDALYFESFKTAFYQEKLYQQSVDGRFYALAKILVATFQHIHWLVSNGLSCAKDHIQWIVTVPTSCSHVFARNLEMWFERALINNNLNKIDNPLQLVYESDCVALGARVEFLPSTDNLDPVSSAIDREVYHGQRYIAMDAGASTVDFAWCQINTGYHIEAIHHATSGQWGSAHIDAYFELLLVEVFGEYAIKEFKSCHPQNYVQLKESFRTSKISFDGTRNLNPDGHNVRLSSEFCHLMGEYATIHCNVDTDDYGYEEYQAFCGIIRNAKPFGLDTGHLQIEDDVLFISHKIWKECLFDKVINPIIDHMSQLIPIVNDTDDASGNKKNIKYLFICGGLAQSKYFRQRIQEAFHQLIVKISQTPTLCVMHGAMKLALEPGCITTIRASEPKQN